MEKGEVILDLKEKIRVLNNSIKIIEKLDLTDLSERSLLKISEAIHPDETKEKESFFNELKDIKKDSSTDDKDFVLHLRQIVDLKLLGLKKKKENYESILELIKEGKKVPEIMIYASLILSLIFLSMSLRSILPSFTGAAIGSGIFDFRLGVIYFFTFLGLIGYFSYLIKDVKFN